MSAVVPVPAMAAAVAVPPPSVTSPAAVSISTAADERDLFIAWLRAEFAAANAVIDLLMSHLRITGVPGEFDHVAAALQQRRAHWVPLIHLQQYFPVGEVAMALQHSAWRRQQGMMPVPQPQQQSSQAPPSRGGRRYGVNGMSYGHGHGNDHGSGYNNGSGFNSRRYFNSNRSDSGTARENVSVSGGGSSEEVSDALSEANNESKQRERETSLASQNCVSNVTDENHAVSHKDGSSENDGEVPSNTKEKKMAPKEFFMNERIDGTNTVNVLEGLKIYEEVVKRSEAKSILSWVNETRDKGRRGELQGQTFMMARKPSRGHGRDIIQLGIPMIEGSFDEDHFPGISRERKVEAIPGIIQDMLDQLVHDQVIPFKPDYCVIDFFYEGDYSQPNMWASYYGKPVCTLCLTECDMVFGRMIMSDYYKGNYKGPLKQSLSPGDLVVLRNKGDELVKRSVPAMRRERVLLTFGKFQPRRSNNNNNNNHSSLPSNSASSSSSLSSPLNPSARSFTHLPLHTPNPKSPQPVLLPPVPVPIPVPVVAAPLTQATSHPIVPGTGVFLPPPPPPLPLSEYFQVNFKIKPNGISSGDNGMKHGGEGNGNGTAEADDDSGAK